MRSTVPRTLLASPPPVVVVWLVTALIAGRSVTTSAANWNVQEGIAVQETLTDNVLLQPAGQAQSDLVSDIAPYIHLNGQGDRLKLNLNYSPHLLVYANNPDLDTISNNLNATSQAELIKNLFFFDANALAAQEFISPFGSTQADLAVANQNRVETYALQASPYFKGTFGPEITWQARDDTIWAWTSGSAYANSTSTLWSGFLQTPVQTFGARIEYRRQDLSSPVYQQTLETEASRAYLYFVPISSLKLFAIGGHEDNNYNGGQEMSNPIYGGGFEWRPSPLTGLSATVENRYFGTGYNVAFDHRTRLTAWHLGYSRDASSYPQQLFSLPPGNTALLLDSELLSQIPDPAERAAAVQQIIRQSGLPPFLTASQSVFTQQIFLAERAEASLGVLGVRNTLTFTAFRNRQQSLSPVIAPVINDVFANENGFTTRGLSVALIHTLTAVSTITGSNSYTHTIGSPVFSESTLNQLLVRWTRRLSPKTNTFLGARHVRFDAEGAGFTGYREEALIAGFDHIF